MMKKYLLIIALVFGVVSSVLAQQIETYKFDLSTVSTEDNQPFPQQATRNSWNAELTFNARGDSPEKKLELLQKLQKALIEDGDVKVNEINSSNQVAIHIGKSKGEPIVYTLYVTYVGTKETAKLSVALPKELDGVKCSYDGMGYDVATSTYTADLTRPKSLAGYTDKKVSLTPQLLDASIVGGLGVSAIKREGFRVTDFGVLLHLPLLKVPTGGDLRGNQEAADSLTVSIDTREFLPGAKVRRYGIRGRLDSKLKGWEAVAYISPFRAILDKKNQMLGAVEFEAGVRNATEFKNPTTISGVQKNAFARLGTNLEYLPRFGDINAQPGKGFGALVRLRGWADWFDGDIGRSIRYRPFFDSELNWHFSSEYRAFVRYEQGYLPPDLSNNTQRWFVGVGAAW